MIKSLIKFISYIPEILLKVIGGVALGLALFKVAHLIGASNIDAGLATGIGISVGTEYMRFMINMFKNKKQD